MSSQCTESQRIQLDISPWPQLRVVYSGYAGGRDEADQDLFAVRPPSAHIWSNGWVELYSQMCRQRRQNREESRNQTPAPLGISGQNQKVGRTRRCWCKPASGERPERRSLHTVISSPRERRSASEGPREPLEERQESEK